MSKASSTLLILLALLPAATCDREPSTTYGFVATLGNDTTSVERITRTGNHIVSDAVGRSPLVVHRHWEADLAPDGTITNWNMQTRFANPPAGNGELHHRMTVTGNSVRLVRVADGDSSDVTYQKPYAVVVPWNAFLYGSYEVLFNAAGNHPDSAHIGHYFFEGWDEGHIGYARVRRLGGGKYSISSTGLAGSGIAQLDDSGRMLSYSGEGTTYKQEVKRIDVVPDIDALTARFAADEKAKGAARALSVRDTSRANVGGADVAIEYSRPLARGRKLVGGLIPYDQVWRTGANAATHITVSAPVQLGGVNLDKGTYTLWTLPTTNDVKLIINRQTGQWGTGYASQHDIARVAMQVDTLTGNVERFTIRVDSATQHLVMEWGDFRWSVPITPRR
jgi:hypothetical protein